MNLYLQIAIALFSFIAGALLFFKKMQKLQNKIVDLELNMLNDQEEIFKLKHMLTKEDVYAAAVYDAEQFSTAQNKISNYYS